MPALRLALHDVRDAEALCASVAARSGLKLSHYEAEDLRAYLVVECWKLAEQFQAGAVSFSSYATVRLRRRVVDWQRQRFGRTRWTFRDRVHERRPPDVVSLDEHDAGLEQALAAGAGDRPAGGDADLSRLVGERRRWRSRDLETLGLRAPRRAA